MKLGKGPKPVSGIVHNTAKLATRSRLYQKTINIGCTSIRRRCEADQAVLWRLQTHSSTKLVQHKMLSVECMYMDDEEQAHVHHFLYLLCQKTQCLSKFCLGIQTRTLLTNTLRNKIAELTEKMTIRVIFVNLTRKTILLYYLC